MEARLKTRQEIMEIVTAYLAPHIQLVRNPALRERKQNRIAIDALKPANIITRMAADCDVYGLYLHPDLRTMEYCDDTVFHDIIHESAHILFLRKAFDYDKYAPDLLAWSKETKDQGYPYIEIEEMSATMLGYIWLANMDLTLDALALDASTPERDPQWKFDVGGARPLLEQFPETFRVTPEGMLHLRCTSDFTAFFRLAGEGPIRTRAELREKVLANPLWKNFGTRYFQYAGIVDENGFVKGRLDRAMVRENGSRYRDLFRLNETAAGEFIEFLCR